MYKKIIHSFVKKLKISLNYLVLGTLPFKNVSEFILEFIYLQFAAINKLNLMCLRTHTFSALQAIARHVELVSESLERSHRAFDGMNEEEWSRSTLNIVEGYHSGTVRAD